MSNFLEVIPGVCISTRRIVSIEVQEHKGVSDTDWVIIVFTDMPGGTDGNSIWYVYMSQHFNDRDTAMAKLAEIVGQCSADA